MNFSNMTILQLKTFCKEHNIKGFSGKNKQQLIKKIQKETPDVKTPDSYTIDILRHQYRLHKSYVLERINTTKQIGLKVRLPCIPEDISENLMKCMIHTYDTSTRWDCKSGDLESAIEGAQECKCFTSDAPLSFTPSSHWDVLYFLDARDWLNDTFTLYRVPLKRTSTEWKNIQISKTQTFEDQTKQGRRPRISWNKLYPLIQNHTTKVYEGTLDHLFPIEATE